MTFGYAHLSPAHKQSAVDALGDALKINQDKAEASHKTA
jgi:hypothetical protein